MKKTKPHLSIIIPVYNETQRLSNIPIIAKFLKNLPFTTELIVVDDGSTDNTLKRLRSLKIGNLTILHYRSNRGKGHALRYGMLFASGIYRLFMDVDLSVPLEAIHEVLPHLEKHDIVIGTRKQGSSRVILKQSLPREWLGKGFTWLSRTVLGLRVTDFTCGFKAYREEAARALFQRSRIHRWGFDSELMFLAKHLNLSFKEVPVTWKNDPRTKVKFPHDILRSLRDLLAIRLNHFLKRY